MATGRQVDEAVSETKTSADATTASAWWSGSITLLFPEAIPAAFILLLSPVWIVSLLFHGHFVAALVLVIGVAAAVVLLRVANRSRSAGLVYVAILILLLAGLGAYQESKGP
jgi:hypothetical protein